MNQKKEEKYVEDLLNEKDIDVIAVLNARFRHPIKTFIRYKLFVFKVNIKEYMQRLLESTFLILIGIVTIFSSR